MNKKGVAVPAVLITRVLGGVIVLFILWMIVSPFASTLLNYMNLAKNVESFNKFTTAYSRACTSGNSLMTDFTLT
ncbi:MAG TPA: hypothetical protein ENN30_02240, partial [Candidatus Woesearchaeota archaeon]|nr:hypothetical protein [Candidatus Woesearchaeota archaeon]